jgi:hypothetical protein
MADYGFNTQLTPQTQQTSLADMINLARGIQAYQQSQQMNPFALQQQAQATEKGGLELQSTKQANQERLAVLPFLQDPANYTNEDGTIDTNKALKEIYARAPQTGHLYAKNLTDLANSQYQVAQNKQNLTQSGKTILVNTLGPDAYSGEQDPKVYIDKLNKAVKIDPSLKGIATAYTNMLSQLKPGEHIPSDMLKEIQGLQPASEQFSQFAPQAGTVSLGGTVQPTITQKSVAGSTPSITPSGQGMAVTPTPGFQTINGIVYWVDKNGNLHTPNSPSAMNAGQTGNAPPAAGAQAPQTAPNKPAPPVPAGTTRMSLVQEDMPVPQGGLRQMNTQQQARYDNGQKIFADAAEANKTAADQGIVLNTIKQNLAQAQSSRPGQLLRQGGKWVAGNENLDTLVKSLAQNQILQAKIMGVDSVNAERTSALANGSENIDPKSLAKIVEQTDATKTAVQQYNQGLSTYKNRDSLNSPIHADRFQQAWKENYDPRIFMVENINNSNMTPDQKSKEIKRIIGIATPAELKQLQQKALNIRRLQTGDF